MNEPSDHIAWSPTPSAMINRLLPTISNDRTIASYVGAHFGQDIPLKLVANMRSRQPSGRGQRAIPSEEGPNKSDKAWRDMIEEGSRRLLDRQMAVYPDGVPA